MKNGDGLIGRYIVLTTKSFFWEKNEINKLEKYLEMSYSTQISSTFYSVMSVYLLYLSIE